MKKYNNLKINISIQIPLSELDLSIEKLKQLSGDYKQLPQIPWQFKSHDHVISIYKTGKLVYSGTTDSIPYIYLLKDFVKNSDPSDANDQDYKYPWAGSDETGKGDYFGPLVVTCCLVENQEIYAELRRIGVRDNKEINDNQVKRINQKLVQLVKYATVLINPSKYNQLYQKFNNLNHLLSWAHLRAAENLSQAAPNIREIIVDRFAAGNYFSSRFNQRLPQISLREETKAEKHLAVAAAALISRGAFLNSLDKLEKEIGYPLPKGASSKVITAARKIVSNLGSTSLAQVAKLHFKTTDSVLAAVD